MASVILRAAARAASLAAWGASRCATAAAASDPLMCASSVAAAATARSPASSGSVHPPIAARHPRSRLSHGSGSTIAPLPPRFVKPDWAIFEADDKDLESDQMKPYGPCTSAGASFLTRSVTATRWLAGSPPSRRLCCVWRKTRNLICLTDLGLTSLPMGN
ncbi:unnamed protein product [Miscanthus lutarioriparius]|uniref:Uncharacterized protein n=1 Tax=Miscanthus lutarioriparius TaxID=422564 RepID=A0A811R868_9POAL|nr:unnamed protein product [Miscanthus lutarioriparius]